MGERQCPVNGCHYLIPEAAMDNPGLAIVHLQGHLLNHKDQDRSKIEAVKRPTISAAGTSQDWIYFLSRWGDYLKATKVKGEERAIQLLECCDQDLRKGLQRNNGGVVLSGLPLAEIIDAIKVLAVRVENPTVARDKLHNMSQDREESGRAFGARLRGQAATCQYAKLCTCGLVVDYTEENVADALITGLADPDIKQGILGEPNQPLSMERAMLFVESKEAAKTSVSQLDPNSSVNALRSEYKKASRQGRPRPDLDGSDPRCYFCGKTGHGKYPSPSTRSNECKAFGHTCSNCGKPNHSERVCKSKPPPKQVSENAIFTHVCNISTHAKRGDRTMDHHVFDGPTESWVRKQSLPQPTRRLVATLHPSDYAKLKIPRRPRRAQCSIEGIPDTGCQSCLAGTRILRQLGLSKSNLIPVSQRMQAANKSGIEILGAILLEFSLADTVATTKQMVYVTPNVTRLFLSREACSDLGIIPPSFPCTTNGGIVSIALPPRQDPAPKTVTRPCSCPTRCLPPSGPIPLPVPATEANRDILEQHLRKIFRASTFNTCTHQTLPMMAGPPLRLNIDPSAKPVAARKAASVPVHWEDKVKAHLDRDVRLGVLEKVPIGTPDTWCHRMLIVGKANGEPRRVVDFQPLNAHATRETHHTKSPYHQARGVPKQVKKSVFDAWNGYHSVPLHPDDTHYTTFITPWGRYRYLTAPQGYKASGDGYTARFDGLIEDITNKTKCVDDTLIWSDSIEQAFHDAAAFLFRCGSHGITLTPDKFVFAQDTVTFAGFEIGNSTVKPARKFTKAIAEFPTPASTTDVRSWFGLVNQVAYAFSRAATMAPFRDLLKPATTFAWSTDLQEAFDESKQTIIEQINAGVEIFERNRPTCIATDWSKTGIGYWMFQKHCDCPQRELFCCKDGWKITLVGSRFTHDAESRYAAIEGEALAVADALEKCRHFVLGCTDLYIAVDHKPLVKIFGDRALADISNARLRNLKEKTLPFAFTMLYIPGVRNLTSDALSRYPSGSHTPQGMSLQDVVSAPPPRIPLALMAGLLVDHGDEADEEELVDTLCSSLESRLPITWQRLKEATTSDDAMQLLLTAIEEGFPDKQADVPTAIRPFHIHRSHLYSADGVAIYKDRVVIPAALRDDCLDALHSAHQGTSLMQSKADSAIFWPGIARDITNHRASCLPCNTMSPSQASLPPTPPTLPTRPFQCICADYFHYRGHNYVVIVDRFSGWPIVDRSTNGATGLTSALRSTFVTFGIPDDITTDGGPEFTASTTRKFLADWGVHHRISSVANPHSNARAEIGVKTVKRALAGNTPENGNLDTDAFQRAMLTYRNTPDPVTKISPAIAVFARPIKDLIPVLPGKLRLHPYWDKLLDEREATMATRGAREDDKWSEHCHPLTSLRVGDRVRVQNQTGPFPRRWDKVGIITEVKQYHQYWVRMCGSGRATLRNRKFLRKCATPTPTNSDRRPPVIAPMPAEKDHRSLQATQPLVVNVPEPLQREVETATAPPALQVRPLTPIQAIEPIPTNDTITQDRTRFNPSVPITPERARSSTNRTPRRSRRQCVLNYRPNYKD